MRSEASSPSVAKEESKVGKVACWTNVLYTVGKEV
jgi:hypothetical protein